MFLTPELNIIEYYLATAHASDSCLMPDYVRVINFLLLLLLIITYNCSFFSFMLRLCYSLLWCMSSILLILFCLLPMGHYDQIQKINSHK